MSLIQALILGIVQGLTEFLPVSSSAHLVLVPHLLGWQLTDEFIFPFDVLVQLGTLLALLIYFRNDLKEIFISVINGLKNKQPFKETPARIGWLAVLATIPAGLFGLLFKGKVEAAFKSPVVTAAFLIFTAGLLILAEFGGKRTKELEQLSWVDALWIGSFQALSIFPGISRSGSTITGGMTRQLKRKPAGEFSFIMAIPVFLAAALLGLKDLLEISNFSQYLPVLIVGFLAAAVVGYIAISWLLRYITAHSLLPFAGYCLMLGAASIAFFALNPQDIQAKSIESHTLMSAKPIAVAKSDASFLAISPDLEWLLPEVVECQANVGWQDLIISQQTNFSETQNNTQIFLSYGEQSLDSSEVFQVGSDALKVIVNSSNSMTSLPEETASLIFSGKVTSWDEITNVCPDCFSGQPPSGQVNLYVYPPGSYLEKVSRSIVTNGQSFSSKARITPDTRSLIAAVSQDKLSLGIVPSKWNDGSVLNIYDINAQKDFQIPILAFVSQPMSEIQKAFLGCLQQSIH